MTGKQNVNAIVVRILRHRARQRCIPISPRRIIKVYPGLKGDYRINRHEIKIKLAYATRGNPFEMIDPVLNAVVDFDMIAVKEQAQRITRVKSQIMMWSSYLERTLSKEMHSSFVLSLLPSQADEKTLHSDKDRDNKLAYPLLDKEDSHTKSR